VGKRVDWVVEDKLFGHGREQGRERKTARSGAAGQVTVLKQQKQLHNPIGAIKL
jgi:hypothetical protein